MKRTFAAVAVILLLLPCGFIPCASAQKAALSNIVVTNTRDHLLLYLTITDCFTEEMVEAIENGIRTTFTFFIRLYEVREWQPDAKIADVKVHHHIEHDSLKKIYRVELSEKENNPTTVADFEKAKKLMSEIVGLEIAPLTNVEKGKRYQLRMMAELEKIRLPLGLQNVLFFLSLWDFETDWYSLNFRY